MGPSIERVNIEQYKEKIIKIRNVKEDNTELRNKIGFEGDTK